MLTADTITVEQIRELYAAGVISYDLLEFSTFPAWTASHAGNREICAKRWNERERLRDIDSRRALEVLRDLCPGRLHARHVREVCNGSCCTTCGGPIDIHEECRC